MKFELILAVDNRHLHEIASGKQAEFLKLAQAQYEQHNRSAQSLVDSLAKNAPAGSEAAITALKSAYSTASLTYETVRKGVTVNTISPGYLATKMVMAIPQEIVDTKILPQIPAGRLGKPEEVA